jgi:hypothetical protein
MVPEEAVEAVSLLGRWVRIRSDRLQESADDMYREPGRPFKVHFLGHVQRDGRRRIYGPVECCWPEDVEALTKPEEEKAREEWERNVR